MEPPLGQEGHRYVRATLAGEAALDAAYRLAGGASLASVVPGDGAVHATVIVKPDRVDRWLRTKLTRYANELTAKGRPRNEALVASLESLEAVRTPRGIFMDASGPFPTGVERVWWQIWTAAAGGSTFRAAANELGVVIAEEYLNFPDQSVFLASATVDEVQMLMDRTGTLLELRRPEIPGLLRLSPAGEHDVLGEVRRNVVLGAEAVSVCLLDAGVYRSHVLLSVAIAEEDCHTYDPAWAPDDCERGDGARHHGTGMAGLALYGDLHDLFTGAGTINLSHRLESVKMLPDHGPNEPHLYGAITAESIARLEVAKPERRRVYCLPITAEASADGAPSAWSAAVDNACFNDGAHTRLVLIAAGNVERPTHAPEYPHLNELSPIQSPAQAWNALTVGACTRKANIVDQGFEGWSTIATECEGLLSPSSRTSVRWIRRGSPPVKPDFVSEGGNWATDGEQTDCPDSLQLITTRGGAAQSRFQMFGDTSAATALAARSAARIWSANPDLWPETVRALLVHSASWPQAVDAEATTQVARERILRKIGYGSPDEQRASMSTFNDVTLISEHSIQPFRSDGGTGGLLLFRLPWPVERLQEMAALQVELRVTLSYFIQPKPGNQGGKGKYSYPSHQLRFDLKQAGETLARFQSRINGFAERVVASASDTRDPWRFGDRRNCGSLHSDIWFGDAADLAKRDHLAVFPAGGWWKESRDPRTRARSARFSLVVTLRAPELAVAQADLYTEIKTVIETQTQIASSV